MNKYWIWFSRINKIGAYTQNSLLKIYKTPDIIWKLNRSELAKNLKDEQINIVLDKKYRDNLEKYIEYIKKKNIKVITIYDKEYPKKLKNIFDPPVVLYVKGNEKILNNNTLAIVGSRTCSEYGKNVAKQFAYNISKQNINIIAGLAKGIDTSAHIGTVLSKGKTIAVLGSAVDCIYPKENERLSEEIIKTGGAVISEYVVGTKPDKLHFPARNRIISGISDGVLVVEASSTSGTFITVDFALEQGKNIYAIPRQH